MPSAAGAMLCHVYFKTHSTSTKQRSMILLHHISTDGELLQSNTLSVKAYLQESI